jgi:hypothetical protein
MCSERSGSNFISKLLNGHNNICGPSPKHIINPVARNLFRYGDLLKDENWDELLNDIEFLLSVDFSVWKKSFTKKDLASLAVKGDIKSLIQNIFMEEARENGKQNVFIKENHIYEFLPFLLIYFPEAKFVYQTRDPRDMALSWKKNLGHPGGVINAAKQWKKDQQQNSKNYYVLNKQGRAHFLRYEDLTANSEQELKWLVDFLGLPFDEGIFDFHKDEITQKNASMLEAWNNLSQGVMTDNSRKYLNELSTDEIKAIEKICWFEMKHLGYEPEFSYKELADVTDESLEEFHQKEVDSMELCQSEGVKANILAKSQFYQR